MVTVNRRPIAFYQPKRFEMLSVDPSIYFISKSSLETEAVRSAFKSRLRRLESFRTWRNRLTVDLFQYEELYTHRPTRYIIYIYIYITVINYNSVFKIKTKT